MSHFKLQPSLGRSLGIQDNQASNNLRAWSKRSNHLKTQNTYVSKPQCAYIILYLFASICYCGQVILSSVSCPTWISTFQNRQHPNRYPTSKKKSKETLEGPDLCPPFFSRRTGALLAPSGWNCFALAVLQVQKVVSKPCCWKASWAAGFPRKWWQGFKGLNPVVCSSCIQVDPIKLQ